MDVHIHRVTVSKDYTLSRLSFAGGQLDLLEPPLPGLVYKKPQGLSPNQNRIFLKEIDSKVLATFPRCGYRFKLYLEPAPCTLEPGKAIFRPTEDRCPLLVGCLSDEAMLEPDPETWTYFYNRLLLASKQRERIQVVFS